MDARPPSWVTLRPGDHLVALYREVTEKSRILEVIAQVTQAADQVAIYVGGQLPGLELSPDEYLTAEGSFSLSGLRESLNRRRSAAGTPAGDPTWLVVDAVALASGPSGCACPEAAALLAWEEAAAVLLAETPMIIVCLYDRARVDEESAVRAFCRHQYFLEGDRLAANPIFLGSPKAFQRPPADPDPASRPTAEPDRHSELLETFRRIGDAALSLPPEELLDIALDAMMDILRVDVGFIRAVDPQSSPMPILAHRGIKPETLALAAETGIGRNISGTVSAGGEGILAGHAATDPRAVKAVADGEGLSSAMSLPLKVGRRVIGVLSLAAKGGRVFTEDEFRLARSVTSAFSHFLLQAVLYGEATGQAKRMAATARLTTAASLPTDLSTAESIAREGAVVFQGDSCACLVFTDGWTADEGEPFIFATHGSEEDLGLTEDASTGVLGSPAALVGGALRAGQVTMRANRWGPKRVLIVPLVHGGLVLGAIIVGRGPGAPPFTSRHIGRASSVGSNVAIALLNQRLATARSRQTEDARLASRIGNRVAGLLEVKEALTETARLVAEMVGEAKVDIWLQDPDGQLRVAASHDAAVESPGEEGGGGGRVEDGPRRLMVEQTMSSGQSTHENRRFKARTDGSGGEGERPRLGRVPPSFESRVCVPLKLGGPAIGVLELRAMGPRSFDPDRIPALESIAEHLVATIRNGLLFEEVNRSRRQLELIMANMGEPLVVMEPGGVISFMNAAALKVLGEHTGRRCHELMVGRHDPCPDCPLPWDSSDNWTYRYIRESATGRIRDVVASSLPTDDGPAVVAIIRDITEERLMHDYLAKHELMSAMGEMASGVAHNFNNILTGILGTVDDLKRQPTLEKMYPAMMVIERAAIDGTDLIRRLQASSRTSEEPGQVIDLRTVIQDAVHVTRPRWKSQAERAGRAIEVEARAAKGLTVRGQPAELRQVFINLILNAIDALPDGGRIEIVAAAADGTVEARVSDDGIGMTKEVMAKLFQPFFTTKGQKGSGLGLSTVYNILRNHGGGITVDSAPGIGTTFTVTLPLCEPTEEAADEVGPTALDERGEPGQVLIVDDDLLVLEVLASLVAAGGHQVKTANRGADALQMLAEVPFDVIVTDLGMPEMSGWQVAEGARKLRPQTGIVLLTGWGANLGDDENRRALVDLVLAKPVRVDELLAAVARVRRMRLNPRANEQPA